MKLKIKLKILVVFLCLFSFINVRADEKIIPPILKKENEDIEKIIDSINNEVKENKEENKDKEDKKENEEIKKKKEIRDEKNIERKANIIDNCDNLEVSGKQLNLLDLIKIGICNNPNLNKEFINIKVSESKLKQQKSEYLPTISASVSTQESDSKVQGGNRTEQNPYNATLSLNWLLYDFGGRSARVKEMKNELDSNVFSYNAEMQDLILSINTKYLNLLSAKESLKSAEANEITFGISYKESSKRYEIGSASLNDKLQAKTSYEQSTLEVIDARNKVKKYMGDLAVLLNLPPETEFDLKDLPTDSDMFALKENETIENLMQIALEKRFELKEKQSILEANLNNVKNARSNRLPTINLSASTGYSDSWKKETDYTKSSSVKLSLTMPIFTGFSTVNQVSEAKYKYQQARLDLRNTENTIRNEVWTAYQDYLTSVESYNLSKQILESAEENEKVAFKSYEVGKIDIINLLTATSQLADARQGKITAFYNVLVSKANLYKAIGRF